MTKDAAISYLALDVLESLELDTNREILTTLIEGALCIAIGDIITEFSEALAD
jgi:hypothetical protein